MFDNPKLNQLLEYINQNVKFYSNHFKKMENKIDFENIPLVTKKMIIDDYDSFLANEFKSHPVVSLEELRSCNDKNVIVYEYTSGSSGYPLQCFKTPKERMNMGLNLLKKRRAIYKKFSNANMFCFIHNEDYHTDSFSDSLGNLEDTNILNILTYLRDVKRPDVIHANPMLLLYYADFIIRNFFDLKQWNIEFIESVSEGLTISEKQKIEYAFKTKVINSYGCLECYNIAYECPSGNLHVDNNILVEIVDDDTGKIIEGYGKDGEIVITSLLNRVQPFVRYKTGDIGHIINNNCTCGDKGVILNLTGRRKLDFVKLLFATNDKKLNICGYDLFYGVMNKMVRNKHDYVSWFNIIQQKTDTFDVLYLKKGNFSDLFFNLFHQYSEDALGMKIEMNFIEKSENEVLYLNRKNRVFKSNVQIS